MIGERRKRKMRDKRNEYKKMLSSRFGIEYTYFLKLIFNCWILLWRHNSVCIKSVSRVSMIHSFLLSFILSFSLEWVLFFSLMIHPLKSRCTWYNLFWIIFHIKNPTTIFLWLKKFNPLTCCSLSLSLFLTFCSNLFVLISLGTNPHKVHKVKTIGKMEWRMKERRKNNVGNCNWYTFHGWQTSTSFFSSFFLVQNSTFISASPTCLSVC